MLSGKTYGSIVEQEVRELDDCFKKPSISLDPSFKDQAYDLFCTTSKRKCEIKGVRVTEKMESGNRSAPIDKAIGIDSTCDFWANFQQVKPALVDSFILVLDWADAREYYFVPSNHICKGFPGFQPHQHKGNIGEYQIWMTRTNYCDFAKYKVSEEELIIKIKSHL